MKNTKFKSTEKNFTFYCIKSVLIGVAVTFIFILLFSLLMYFVRLNDGFFLPFATVSVAAGSLAAAYYSASKKGEKGYLTGLICGGITFAAVTLISLAIDKGGLTLNTVFHFFIIMTASLFGGILGVNKGKNKKYI